MAETKARFLANLIGATNTDNDFTLPNVAVSGTNNKVLTSGGDGTVTWEQTIAAPTITSVSGLLNDDSDSTLTIIGTEYSATSTVKLYDASTGGSEVASSSSLNTSGVPTKLVATFGHANLTKNALLYVEVTNSGLTTRHGTGIRVSGDPIGTGSTASDWFSGASGANHNDSTHLGTYASTVTAGNDSNTKILLNFDKTDGSTTITNDASGGSYTVSAQGTAKIKSSPFGDGKTAMEFDGSDDKISISGSTDLQVQTADFTIEQWVWFDAVDVDQGIWAHTGSGTNASPQLALYFEAGTDKITLRRDSEEDGGASKNFQCNWNPSAKQWYHIALVRYSNQLYIYANGTALNQTTTTSSTPFSNGNVSATNALTNMATDQNFLIGCDQSDGRHFDGFIDEFRIVSRAVYTGSFTVPTTRLGTTQSNQGTNISDITGTETKMLIHSNQSSNGTIDGSGNSNGVHGALSVTGATHSTGHGYIDPAMAFPNNLKNFGSSGVQFDGDSDWLQILNFTENLTNSYSFEFYFNLGTTGANQGLLYFTDSGNSGYLSMLITSGNKLALYADNDGSGWDISNDTQGTTTFSANTWYHLLFVRDSSANTYKIFLDGSSTPDISISSSTNVSSSTSELMIGYNDYDYTNGHIDSFRWYSGVLTAGSSAKPSQIYGGNTGIKTIPTITFEGTATSPSLAGDEDIHFTEIENTSKAVGQKKLSDLGLAIDNTYGNANQASLTGNLNLADNVQVDNLGVKVQVRKTLSNSAGTSGQATITFSGGTTTAGLSPDMIVTGTGINSSETKITSVDSSTQITVNNNHAGTVSGDLIFYDPDRVHFINKGDVWDNPSSGGLSIKG